MAKAKNKKLDAGLNGAVYLASIVYPLTSLPQLYKIYSTKSADDFAIASWILYFVLETILLIYAIQRKLTPIIIQDTLWLIVYGVTIIGIMLYSN